MIFGPYSLLCRNELTMCVVEVSLYIPILVGLSLNFIDSSCVQVCGIWLLHDNPLALGAGVWWPGRPALHLL